MLSTPKCYETNLTIVISKACQNIIKQAIYSRHHKSCYHVCTSDKDCQKFWGEMKMVISSLLEDESQIIIKI